MTTAAITPQSGVSKFLHFVWSNIKKIPPVYPVFLVLFIVVSFLSPTYSSMNGIMAFLRRTAPLAILAIGQMIVLSSGGFDLSIGSLVTMVCLGSSLLLNNDPANAYPAIGIMMLIGISIGMVNGLVVSYLKVPSFIVTLGMMLLVKGLVLYWVGGAPKGYFTDNWRMWGRGYIENVPVFGRFPIGLIVLIVVGLLIWYLYHRTNFGKQVLAIGDNVRAARLSGVRVNLIRVAAFVTCSILAVIGGVMTGGYGGVNVTIGEGMEMQAIAACVVGGVLLGGGKGNVLNVIFGAYTLEILISMLTLLGLPKPYKDVVQGLIIIGAVAYVAYMARKKR
ncbi:MAG TPA: ABC transporter permease [Bellilinea sp.]